MKEVLDILSTSIFRAITNNQQIKITQLNAAISLLIKGGIPFDVSYSPGTARIAAQAQLTIFIKSGVTLNLKITFETGELVFT